MSTEYIWGKREEMANVVRKIEAFVKSKVSTFQCTIQDSGTGDAAEKNLFICTPKVEKELFPDVIIKFAGEHNEFSLEPKYYLKPFK